MSSEHETTRLILINQPYYPLKTLEDMCRTNWFSVFAVMMLCIYEYRIVPLEFGLAHHVDLTDKICEMTRKKKKRQKSKISTTKKKRNTHREIACNLHKWHIKNYQNVCYFYFSSFLLRRQFSFDVRTKEFSHWSTIVIPNINKKMAIVDLIIWDLSADGW